jgi:hypothetical protein
MLTLPPAGFPVHPKGEQHSTHEPCHSDTFVVQTPGGVFHVTYDTEAEVSHLGGVVPFAQFLQASGLFTTWVDNSPLCYASNRALSVRDILGTLVLSLIGGHYRFAHITALRGDTVTPQLLGMDQVASEDAVRRGLKRLVCDESECTRTMSWLRHHVYSTLAPLMTVPWTLDMDVTVKPVYGRQSGSVVGYNPHKPGRPSHALHSFVMAQTRLVLDVAVHAGNEHTANHSLPELQRLLGDLPRDHWPSLLRGDCGFGTDDIMTWSEGVGLHYLFKQRMTTNTKHLVAELDLMSGWTDTGQGWEGKESALRLSTWQAPRRVVVLRRPRPEPRYIRARDAAAKKAPQQEIFEACRSYIVDGDFEYQVLVTSLPDQINVIAQRYRDRADCENVFDEIKNHWGWGGFTSRTFAVTQAAAVIGALVYNWWSIFCRMADPDHHREAITTRPTLLHGVIRQTSHSNQRLLTITSTRANKTAIACFFISISRWLASIIANAEQWTAPQRWMHIVKTIFAKQMGAIAVPAG